MHLLEQVLGCFAFSSVPQDSLLEVTRSAVVQEVSMGIHLLLQTYTPEWGCTPFVATGQSADVVVIQSHTHNLRAHIVQQEVAIRMYGLIA